MQLLDSPATSNALNFVTKCTSSNAAEIVQLSRYLSALNRFQEQQSSVLIGSSYLVVYHLIMYQCINVILHFRYISFVKLIAIFDF